jgi:hypothetical protein
MAAEAQEPLSMLAKGIEADGDRSAVGPKHLVSFITDVFALPISGRVSSKKDCECAYHPRLLFRVKPPSQLSGLAHGAGALAGMLPNRPKPIAPQDNPSRLAIPRAGGGGGYSTLTMIEAARSLATLLGFFAVGFKQ